MPDAARVTPDWLGQPALATPAGIPTRAWDRKPRTVVGWSPPPAAEFRYDRTRAGWDRLRRMAASGDRDALVFLTLMQSGSIARSTGDGRAFAP